ncbi:MAG: carbohydrate kinase family protein [Clostridia bacterium]|nr:carbohydrate kinase family protein [Clostridia bacterium]
MKLNKGITIAGTMLCDVVKSIECYPQPGMLSDITAVSKSVGGCVPNTAINLAKIDPSLPISVIGKIGNDNYGKYIVERLKNYGIDCSRISVSDKLPTSFSDVMSLLSGERTFFHYRGANSEFSIDDIDTVSLNCNIFHIGYLLLLDCFDAIDNEYSTVMARFLHTLQGMGIKTSIDAVSSSTLNFEKIIKPAIKYCDYVILNEIECCSIFNISPYKDGVLDASAIKRAMQLVMAEGVGQKVIVHCKSAGFCLDKSGEFTSVPSLDIPSSQIKGSVGAGDAFCAATLYGIYNGYTDKEILEFASAAAACNLFSENSVDGMKSIDGINEMQKNYERKKLKIC